jgi:hypothetical protein
MNRRKFAIALGAGAAPPLAAEPAKPALLELRFLMLRTGEDNQMQRNTEFLQAGTLPAMERAGAGPMGFFASVIAPQSPFLLVLASFPNAAAMEAVREKEQHDPEYRKARAALVAHGGTPYERVESSLLRCFEGVPSVEVPTVDAQRPLHVFELRTYESRSPATLARKIKMFEEAEIGIFRRLGMRPVFFAETIIGSRMPNLTYMLAFDSLADRETKWKAFGDDSEWKQLRSKPGNSDAELVSNISNMILRPLPFSPIR